MVHVILLLAGLVFSAGLTAGSASGRITQIEITNHSAAVLFKLDVAIDRTPRCNESGRFAIDLRKAAGDAAYQALLLARKEGYVVRVEGLNTCSADWKSEDVNFITME